MATRPLPFDRLASVSDSRPVTQLNGKIPAWAQILSLLALLALLKSIPGLPWSGQIFMLFGALLATWFLHQDGQTWRDLGLRWASNGRDYAKGAAMVVTVMLTSFAINAAVMYGVLAITGAPAERTFFDVSTVPLYLFMLTIVWTTNAFGEEMIFRGMFMSRFAVIFGGTRFAWLLAAFAQAAIFGLGHAYQGIIGIIITGVVGLAFGLLYLVARRNLWPMIIAHGLINTAGITILHLQQSGAIEAVVPAG